MLWKGKKDQSLCRCEHFLPHSSLCRLQTTPLPGLWQSQLLCKVFFIIGPLPKPVFCLGLSICSLDLKQAQISHQDPEPLKIKKRKDSKFSRLCDYIAYVILFMGFLPPISMPVFTVGYTEDNTALSETLSMRSTDKFRCRNILFPSGVQRSMHECACNLNWKNENVGMKRPQKNLELLISIISVWS